MIAVASLPDLTEEFQCQPLAMRLTRGSCADFWRSAQTLPKDSMRSTMKCRACPVGAQHAGRTIVVAAVLPQAICCRCHQPASKLVDGRICVSCYNRAREVVIGYDRRNQYKPSATRKPPTFGNKWSLHPVYASVLSPTGTSIVRIKQVAREQRDTGLSCGEVLLAAMRGVTGAFLLSGSVNAYALIR